MQHSPNIISRIARNSTLSAQNADPDNWEWKGESRSIWEPALEPWQNFHAKWYGATESQSASLVDPISSPSLSLEPLPRGLDPSISSSIFVPKSYVTMFDTVWAQGMAAGGRHGVIITGQPGTGKTLFNYYLLVRLLQQKQIVLFSPDGEVLYLWYFDGVYKTTMRTLAQAVDASLPNPISPSNGFIWSLFDIREPKEPAKPLVAFPCFPVQTTLSDPIRYRTWDEECMPLLTALPLWTRDELAQGLQYQDEYRYLFDMLHTVYKSHGSLTFREEYLYSGVRALLEERYSEEDTVPPSPEDALDYLLDAAIDRFGYSARDVFYGVFDYSGMTWRHEDASYLNYTELQAAASALAHNQSADYSISHWVLALSPVEQGPLERVRWSVGFKSDWVARNVIKKLGEAEDTVIRQQISAFQRRIPQAPRLAERLLEPLAHRYLANATGSFWQPTNMKSNAADPPLFNLLRGSLDVRFIQVKRKIVKLQSISDLLTCLENNTYYIPEDPSFPLFDAFTIELDHEKKLAVLWVIRMTMSRRHGGSSLGYQKIREIIAILKDKLRVDPPRKKSKTANGQATSMPRVQVRYLLVVPKGDPGFQNPQWQFPKGWSQNRNKNDHSGNVYCLEVNLSECSTIIKNVSGFERKPAI